MNELEKKTGMTNEEAEYWDEYLTKNPPKVDPSKNRIKNPPLTILVEGQEAGYVKSTAEAQNKTPSQIIRELVREKMATA
jgi:hypothetical protein